MVLHQQYPKGSNGGKKNVNLRKQAPLGGGQPRGLLSSSTGNGSVVASGQQMQIHRQPFHKGKQLQTKYQQPQKKKTNNNHAVTPQQQLPRASTKQESEIVIDLEEFKKDLETLEKQQQESREQCEQAELSLKGVQEKQRRLEERKGMLKFNNANRSEQVVSMRYKFDTTKKEERAMRKQVDGDADEYQAFQKLLRAAVRVLQKNLCLRRKNEMQSQRCVSKLEALARCKMSLEQEELQTKVRLETVEKQKTRIREQESQETTEQKRIVSEIDQLKSEHSKAAKERCEIEKKASTAKQEIEKLELEGKDMEKHEADSAAAMEAIREKHHMDCKQLDNDKIPDANNTLKEAQEELKKLRAEFTSKCEMYQLPVQEDEATGLPSWGRDDAMSILEKGEKSIQEEKKTIEAASIEIKQLTSAQESAFPVKLAEVSKRLDRAKEKLGKEIEREREQMGILDQLATVKTEIESLQANIEQSEKMKEKSKNEDEEANRRDAQVYKADEAELQKEVDELQEQIVQLETKIEETERVTNSSTSTIKSEAAELNARIEKQKNEIDRIQKEADDLEAELQSDEEDEDDAIDTDLQNRTTQLIEKHPALKSVESESQLQKVIDRYDRQKASVELRKRELETTKVSHKKTRDKGRENANENKPRREQSRKQHSKRRPGGETMDDKTRETKKLEKKARSEAPSSTLIKRTRDSSAAKPRQLFEGQKDAVLSTAKKTVRFNKDHVGSAQNEDFLTGATEKSPLRSSSQQKETKARKNPEAGKDKAGRQLKESSLSSKRDPKAKPRDSDSSRNARDKVSSEKRHSSQGDSRAVSSKNATNGCRGSSAIKDDSLKPGKVKEASQRAPTKPSISHVEKSRKNRERRNDEKEARSNAGQIDKSIKSRRDKENETRRNAGQVEKSTKRRRDEENESRPNSKNNGNRKDGEAEKASKRREMHKTSRKGVGEDKRALTSRIRNDRSAVTGVDKKIGGAPSKKQAGKVKNKPETSNHQRHKPTKSGGHRGAEVPNKKRGRVSSSAETGQRKKTTGMDFFEDYSFM